MYFPTVVTAKAEEIPAYLNRELLALSQSLNSAQPFALLQMLNVAPLKPRDGQIVLADGTHWNPGSGAGFYGYRAGAWRFLG
jgi:hypothetical protein